MEYQERKGVMATEIFTWRPVGAPQGSVTLRRLSAQFGDGFRQAVGDGINNKVQSWPLQFAGTLSDMQSLVSFFDRHAGYRPFLWTPPLGEQGYYEVTAYSPTPVGGRAYTVNATFQQVFTP